ncbi:hypothetical protein [Aquimarina litoralis]|uniref:hypothetical protein n=1 Tax=Aquimarina litoralis TaxID=584605 RepID=UPI001C58FCEA|nr:hypothetical protein [Aquimarina litoralis]MBW1297812.1 hypothetical protein [Aquimarina litoralis]
MVAHFKKKFEEKTDQELLYILENTSSYQDDAVEAAKLILEWRKNVGIEIVAQPRQEAIHDNRSNTAVSSLDPKLYLKSFGKKDLLTTFTVSYFCFALVSLFKFYSDEPFFEDLRIAFAVSLFPVMFSISHFLYRVDHKRLNNLSGRFLQDILLVLFLVTISWALFYLKNGYIRFFSEPLSFADFFAFLLFILIIELFLSIIQRIFLFFKRSNSFGIKLFLIITSCTVLLGISIVRNNFYQKPTYKRWAALNWSDFKGMGVPFTTYAAGISSEVYLETDSVSKSYRAYAAQNDQRSWKKYEDEDSYELLLHEQYHFNITEIFARKMNAFIKKNPNKEYSFYEQKLRDLYWEENEMQVLYDDEADHGVDVNKQLGWEYKIDSILKDFENHKGIITDSVSGASAYFVEAPSFEASYDTISEYEYRYFGSYRYEMNMSLISFKSSEHDIEDPEEFIENFYDINDLRIVSNEEKEVLNKKSYLVLAEDKEDKIWSKNLWVFDEPYFYYLEVEYPKEYDVYPEYLKIADNFIDSFSISNNR